MPVYRYRAAESNGRTRRGVLEAPSSESAGRLLIGRGLHPLAVDAAPPGISAKRASHRDLAIVFRSLSALVTVGVPIERALAASEPLARGPLRLALADAGQRLREGLGLAAALDKSGLVPPVVIGMLRAG